MLKNLDLREHRIASSAPWYLLVGLPIVVASKWRNRGDLSSIRPWLGIAAAVHFDDGIEATLA